METWEAGSEAKYHIAVNFRGSKFFANSEFCRFCWNNFANSLHVHATYVTYYGHGIQASIMPSSTRACSSNAYFEGDFLEGVSCRFGSLDPGCCSSTSCSQSTKSVCVMHQKFLLKYFCERWKICEIKDPQKYSAIQYFPSFYYKSEDGLIALIGLHEW